MKLDTNIAEKTETKQAVCPVCGLNQDVFREMFGIDPNEPTGCELHGPCQFCAKKLED